MNKQHIIYLVVGVAAGYALCNSLNQYQPWKTAYTKGASFA